MNQPVKTPNLPIFLNILWFVNLLKAYAVLLCAWRPMINSPTIRGRPIRMTQNIYKIRNAAPPFCPARTGKRQMLPNPTAEPAVARINPILLVKLL